LFGENKINYTVCVIEDEKVSRKMTIELLMKMEIAKIVSSTNGEVALQKLKIQKTDFIFSDWHMSVMDGLKFYKAVKKEEGLQSTPSLMVTVEGSKERVVEALKFGIRDYIIKSLSSKSFEGKVKSLLKI
jgi:two-component system, chemotaxis family, chemotaxis protein CheY